MEHPPSDYQQAVAELKALADRYPTCEPLRRLIALAVARL